ncbi:MAG: class I SAM-dependent methyltransferase [Pseudomonadales bacterium]
MKHNGDRKKKGNNVNQSEKFWDKKAQAYAKSVMSDETLYLKKLSETQNYLSKDMRVLEFGCGTGTTAIHHAPHVHHIDAIDISENMLNIGRERAKEENIGNISFTRGTLSEFNANTDSIDAVLGLNVIHLLPDRQAAISEVARILKPGGIFVSSTACLGGSYLRFIKLFVPIGKLLGLLPDVSVLTEAELTNDIVNAGFKIESQWHHSLKDISVFIIARKM